MIQKLRPRVRRVAGRASGSQWLVRGCVVLAPFVVVLAAGSAGAGIRWWLVVLIGISGVPAARQPDSHAAGVTLVVLVVFWWWTVPADSGAPVLLAAAGVVTLHVAATLAAYGPPALAIETDLMRLWVGRGLLLWGVAFVAWVTGRLAAPGPVSLVLALVVVAGVAGWAAARFGPAAATGER